MSVSLPPYPIPHQCHQCSSVNRRFHNQPIKGYTGIQYTGTTFVKNVYRRSFALAVHPASYASLFTGVQFNSLLCYLNAWNRVTSSENDKLTYLSTNFNLAPSKKERMLIINKSLNLSFFTVFYFSTKYSIMLGKVADQGPHTNCTSHSLTFHPPIDLQTSFWALKASKGY